MKRKRMTGLMVLLLVLLSASLALAGPGRWGARGSGGWGMGTPYQDLYKPAHQETVAGEVVGIEKTTPMKQMNQGLALAVKTEKETLSIHLGPTWYLERLDTRIDVGDRVEVKGVRTTFFGKPALLASEVKKGDNTLTLRDASGVPVWAGWGRRR